ncbi:MAG: protease pro-enzyme activation domain-containing protein [Nitrosopumilus sp.]|nr:protease pro-enzyme activation domain-containing protein [Nitrosopumilus sp.]MDH3794636.1 protease pro-enzyme activation domain-containing protein [Nitrosopumilus sp.]MDH3855945.1 protease pro-enzyme activation domain-containing protein [Nitrosopumilus sp.]
MSFPELISAEIILKSKSGKSMLAPGVVITSKNVFEFVPKEDSMNKISKILQDIGFNVICGMNSISIEGTKTLFENIFKTKIIIEKKDKSSFEMKNDPPMSIPSSMKNYVEKIFFPEQPEYF